jgi:hypothetical protein
MKKKKTSNSHACMDGRMYRLGREGRNITWRDRAMSIAFGQGARALEPILTALLVKAKGRRGEGEEREEREIRKKEKSVVILFFSSFFFLFSCTSPTGIGIAATFSLVSDDGSNEKKDTGEGLVCMYRWMYVCKKANQTRLVVLAEYTMYYL